MATPKNPDLSRDTSDTNRGLSGATGYDETANGRSTRAQDTAGRQTYGTSGGVSGAGGPSLGQRDFYREALSRSAARRPGTESYASYDRPEDYTAQGYGTGRYGTTERYSPGSERTGGFPGRYEGSREFSQPYGRGEGLREQPPQYGQGFRAQETYRREEHEDSQRSEGSHLPGGRTLALGAAGLAAAGVGLGLMRRGRWAKEPLSASEVMSRGVKTVLPEHTLREVARLMREENVGIVPVTDTQGRLLGVVTDRDLVVRAMSEDRLPSQVRVSDVMSSDDLEVATPDDPVNDIIELMGRKQVRRIPVVERDNRLVGIIAMADIATRAEFDDELQAALERISSRRSFWSRLG